MKENKEVDDRFLFERYKIWLLSCDKLDLHYDSYYGNDDEIFIYIIIHIKNEPKFPVRSISNIFDISIINNSIKFKIYNFREFIKYFEIPYEKINFIASKILENLIENNNNEIKELLEENEKLKSKIKKYWDLVDIPMEFI